MKFDEAMFLIALTERDQDAKEYSRRFSPQWLKNKELIPLLEGMFEFQKEHGISPSLPALHEFMEGKDEEMYNSRWKAAISSLEARGTDKSKMVLALDKAKELGSALALNSLIYSQGFQTDLTNGQGSQLIKQLQQYVHTWSETNEGEGIFNIKEAFDKLIEDNAWAGKPDRIPSGIYPIDIWTNGGLRPRQLGILMAPTGGGKSAALLNIAHSVATVDQLPVLLLTNELSVNEQSERFLARMQKPTATPDGLSYKTLQEIQDNPAAGYKGLSRRWASGLEKRLFISSVDIGQTADDIEEMVKQLRLEEGFMPAVIIVDYMERMAPTSRITREKEYIYLGEIAKELVRLAKRLEVLVWTAVQTNRGGLNKNVTLDMTYGQGSIRHFQEAAFVGSLQKVMVPLTDTGQQNIPCILFAEQKQRHNAMEDRSMFVRHDLSRMYISKDQVMMAEDAEEEVENDNSTNEPGKIIAPWRAKTGN